MPRGQMTDLAALKSRNATRWSAARLTRGAELTKPAAKAVANKATYLSIARRARMPDIAWVFIAVSHYRESSQDFTKNLGQGDPLDRKTVHVPAGRGPFLGPTAFEDAAIDALVNCSPFAARLTDWSIAGMLTNLERYNGLGYANKGVPSPYVWSGTDQYIAGKYVADGVYDPHTVDKQLGCAALIKAMMAIDPRAS
jgi:lysozyme family protein